VKPQYARFALALIGVTVGAHLNLRRLRNAGRRLMLLLVAEALLIPAGVVLALSLWTDAPPAIVLSSVTLSEILGPLAVTDGAVDEVEQPLVVAPHQLAERAAVAVQGGLHDLRVADLAEV